MAIQFDAPFLPDEDYTDFLAAHAPRLSAVYFSLFDELVPDARPQSLALDAETLANHLGKIPGPSKFALLNSRFHLTQTYRAPDRVVSLLRHLHEAGQLDGILFADGYLLRSLSDRDPELAARLEAVPSVNCLLDTAPRIRAWLQLVSSTHYRQPTRLLLDRSLNHKPTKIRQLSKTFPSRRLVLLANEGCLQNCPYKPAHDALMAATAQGLAPDDTFAVSRDLGCLRQFGEQPWLLFSSPYLRPEDLTHLADVEPVIKICGRTRGPAFLTRALSAYMEGRFEGNLLELLDTPEALAHLLHIDNSALPEDFYGMLAECDHDCDNCGICQELERRFVVRKEPAIESAGSTRADF